MNEFHNLVALLLMVNLVAGLYRAYRGPSAADRMMAVQLFGTTSVALFLLLAEGLALPALRDVALLLALLSALGIVAFVRLPALLVEENR